MMREIWRLLSEKWQAYLMSGTQILLLCLVSVLKEMNVFLSMNYVPMGVFQSGYLVIIIYHFFFCGIMRVWNFVCSSIYLWSFEDLTSEYINQARTRCCPGYRGWKLQLIVLEVFGFCTHIQEDALFTVTSRSIFINIPDTLICTFAL